MARPAAASSGGQPSSSGPVRDRLPELRGQSRGSDRVRRSRRAEVSRGSACRAAGRSPSLRAAALRRPRWQAGPRARQSPGASGSEATSASWQPRSVRCRRCAARAVEPARRSARVEHGVGVELGTPVERQAELPPPRPRPRAAPVPAPASKRCSASASAGACDRRASRPRRRAAARTAAARAVSRWPTTSSAHQTTAWWRARVSAT